MYTLIYEINNRKLKKPIKVKITKHYTIENKDLNCYEEGNTEREAINNFVSSIFDMYEDIKNEGLKGKKYKKYLEIFE